MSDIKITLKDDGNIKVDIELPEGQECDEVDAKLRTALALLGLADDSVVDDITKVPIPDGTRNRDKA